MARAVIGAAEDAGLVIRVLPAAYARAGFGRPAEPGQRRFCDPDVATFLERAEALGSRRGRAQRARRAGRLAGGDRRVDESRGAVRHVHAAEQPRELEECQAEHGCSPIELLARTGFLGRLRSVVHGIHVSERDIALLAESGSTVVSCPTTEGNLGDGFPPALRYGEAGVPLAIGTDENLVLDPFEEVRELETLARREGGTRDALLARHGDLWGELARAGAVSLGIEPPPPIAVDRSHPRLRGVSDADLPLALATCGTAAMVLA